MKSYNRQLAAFALLLISGVVFLPGCSWWPFGKKSDTSYSTGSGEVLLSIDGKPALTSSEYEEQLLMACEANPQIKMFLQMMPNAEREFVFRGMTTARLMQAWAHKQGIDQTAEFKKQQKHLHEAMDMQLYMKYFDEAHPVQVSDSDVAAYYEEKKDSIPGLAINPGGIETHFVRFDGKDKAEKFLEKVKEIRKADAFKKVAEEHKHQVGQATINQKSQFGDAIKNAVLDIKKFPSVMIVKAGEGSYWVIFASGKSEAKYHDLKSPQVQQGLRKMIADERKEKQLESLVAKLKDEMNVVENNKYFEDKEAKKRAELEEMSKATDDTEEQDKVQSAVKV